ncbi:MAG: hypothetical protein J6K42_00630 [Clostridia bacterium]|nr:hypothetical protein [Clostridia bacterium]
MKTKDEIQTHEIEVYGKGRSVLPILQKASRVNKFYQKYGYPPFEDKPKKSEESKNAST